MCTGLRAVGSRRRVPPCIFIRAVRVWNMVQCQGICAVCCVLCAVCCVLCAVCCVLCACVLCLCAVCLCAVCLRVVCLCVACCVLCVACCVLRVVCLRVVCLCVACCVLCVVCCVRVFVSLPLAQHTDSPPLRMLPPHLCWSCRYKPPLPGSPSLLMLPRKTGIIVIATVSTVLALVRVWDACASRRCRPPSRAAWKLCAAVVCLPSRRTPACVCVR